ncbi:DUF4282 domain-containing protein [Franconibacter pulveris 1160]|uniref:DUF4282 domain-containing protein n=1 Tax=Franconibacter pulveris TaxID=435910 RepID=A0A0J8VL23_9ENTR|nr:MULTISPECIES: DUF4282 domain-containing protein [Franconibacter]KMV33891.1 hypothetical protein ACH50_14370 [Franconibacter pulveris]MCK1967653.1 DUF4282 domain-containing protein [Franconibacter sp. IITDAS19]MEB5920880.1 DUF4282 domain-containing protein [Franconibacter daqui]GGD13572.1 hypothetical protein GCM10011513_08750 [Franconibacter daqui]
MFSFDKLITPRIISALYIITLAFLVIAAVLTFFTRGFNAAGIMLLIMAVFARIFFECIMVTFKNNEYLRRIAESLEKK